MAHDKKELTTTTNRNSFFQRSFSKLRFSPQLLLLLMASFVKLTSADHLNFKRNDTYYELNGDLWNGRFKDERQNLYTQLLTFLFNGTCDVINVVRLKPSEYVSLWKKEVCFGDFSLARDTISAGDMSFETCLKDGFNTFARNEQNVCNEMLHENDMTALIVLASVFGGMFLMIALIGLVTAIVISINRCQNNRAQAGLPQPNGYTEIPQRTPIDKDRIGLNFEKKPLVDDNFGPVEKCYTNSSGL
jgi:hypothetical protein